MNYAQTIEVLRSLEGHPVELETLITRPADPKAKPEDLRWAETGVLWEVPVEPFSDRPVDEAAHWHRARLRKRIQILPSGNGLLMWAEKFRSAWKEGSDLVVEIAAIRYRISVLVL